MNEFIVLIRFGKTPVDTNNDTVSDVISFLTGIPTLVHFSYIWSIIKVKDLLENYNRRGGLALNTHPKMTQHCISKKKLRTNLV